MGLGPRGFACTDAKLAAQRKLKHSCGLQVLQVLLTFSPHMKAMGFEDLSSSAFLFQGLDMFRV